MAGPKSRSTSVKTEEKLDNTERFINVGIPVELSIGNYNVRELSAKNLIILAAGGLEVLMGFYSKDNDEAQTDFGMYASMVADDKVWRKICDVFAKYCDEKDASVFDDLSLKDFNILIPAIKSVTDFEEIKKVFFQLGIEKYLPIPTSTENASTEKATA